MKLPFNPIDITFFMPTQSLKSNQLPFFNFRPNLTRKSFVTFVQVLDAPPHRKRQRDRAFASASLVLCLPAHFTYNLTFRVFENLFPSSILSVWVVSCFIALYVCMPDYVCVSVCVCVWMCMSHRAACLTSGENVKLPNWHRRASEPTVYLQFIYEMRPNATRP